MNPISRFNAPRRWLGLPAWLLCISALVVLSACGTGKHSFLITQVCLRNEADVKEFVGVIRDIANSNDMEFTDRSAASQKELATVDPEFAKTEARRSPIFIGASRGKRFSFTADNLGMPGYQVAIGFSEDSQPAEAHRFASAVVKKLKERWTIETVPSGTGARGMKECRESQ